MDFNLSSPTGEGSTSTEHLFLFVGSNNETRAYCIDVSSTGTAQEYSILGPQEENAHRLPPEHVVLADKKVGIVGLGSVGSKVAISLARSGIKKFLLIDDDVMLQENVCRHELDWVSVGVHKVDCIKEAISLVAAGIDIHVRRLRIGGQESAESASTALEALSTCDILIDATANHSVFVHLAAIAKRRKRPLVRGEVFAGGIGGLLLRSRPGKDPPPLTMRSAVHEYLSTRQPAPFVIATTHYDVGGEDIPPLTAFDADVSQFSAMMTRFALDTLLNQSPSDFPYSAYLVGMKRSWIFEAPFDTQPISVKHPIADSTNSEEEDAKADQETKEFLFQIVKQLPNDDPGPAQ
jgi:hypothetical protein